MVQTCSHPAARLGQLGGLGNGCSHVAAGLGWLQVVKWVRVFLCGQVVEVVQDVV